MALGDRIRRILPFTEAVTREKYDIVDAPVSRNPVVTPPGKSGRGEIRVATGEGAAAEYARAQSVALMKWKPRSNRTLKGATKELSIACESARIRGRLDKVGIVNPVQKFNREYCDTLADMHARDYQEMAEAFVDAYYTPDFDAMKESWEKRIDKDVAASGGEDTTSMADSHRRYLPEFIERQMNQVTQSGNWCSNEDQALYARQAAREINQFIEKIHAHENREKEETETAPTGEPKPESEMKEIEEMSAAQILDEALKGGEIPEYFDTDDPVEYGEMVILTPDLNIPLPTKLYSRKLHASEEGMFPRYMHRLNTDGAIYAERRRARGGGSVLIDISGSMSLSTEEIIEIMRELSADVVATYCGSSDYGYLTIVGRKGWRCDESKVDPGLGGNVIDGPALEWLAMQPRPRIWISDGGVTCVGDRANRDARIDCALKCSKGSIRRSPSAAALIGQLKRLK